MNHHEQGPSGACRRRRGGISTSAMPIPAAATDAATYMPAPATPTAPAKIWTDCASGLAADGSSTRASSRLTAAKTASAIATTSGSTHQRKAAWVVKRSGLGATSARPGSKAAGCLGDLRRWASPPERRWRPQAFRCSPTSPWWPAMAPPRRPLRPCGPRQPLEWRDVGELRVRLGVGLVAKLELPEEQEG